MFVIHVLLFIIFTDFIAVLCKLLIRKIPFLTGFKLLSSDFNFGNKFEDISKHLSMAFPLPDNDNGAGSF